MAVLLYHWQGSFPALTQYLNSIEWIAAHGIDTGLLFHYGWMGVSWFFVLSGYLLAATLWSRPLRPAPLALFWWRRVIRIYPAVWLQLTVLLVLLWATGFLRQFDWTQALGNYFLWLTPMPGGAAIYNGAHWTLPIELSFYLCLPLMIWWYRRTGIATFLMTCLAISLAWRGGIAWLHHDGSPHAVSLLFIRSALPGMLFLFAAGVALNHWNMQWSDRVRHWGLTGMALAFVALLLVHTELQSMPLQDHPFLLTFEIWLAIPIAISTALLLRPTRWTAWISSAPLVWLGEVSYGLYLWHFPIQRMLPRWWPADWHTPWGSFWALVISTVGSLILASLSYYWFERPVLQRLSGRSTSSQANQELKATAVAAG